MNTLSDLWEERFPNSVRYLIEKDPSFEAMLPYEDSVIKELVLAVRIFTEDAITVHKIIPNNIHDDSEAYT